MARSVALLGSINVGGNRLKMSDLRATLEKHGFENVDTVVASGNVLYDTGRVADRQVEEKITAILNDEFGIATFVTVRNKPELTRALKENPFAGKGEDKLVHVLFLAAQPETSAFEKLAADHEGRGSEKILPGTRALHIDFIDGVAGSKLTGPFIEKRLGCKGTARNVRSIKRIIEEMG